MTEPRVAVLEVESPVPGLVLAGGGLLIRRSLAGKPEIAVVHRPGREDWSFPKGKVEPEESLVECALREVFEETGLVCRLGRFVGTTEYRDRKDRPKIVSYWAMEVESGSFKPNNEVDGLSWLDLDAASSLLTYERDRELLGSLEEMIFWRESRRRLSWLGRSGQR